MHVHRVHADLVESTCLHGQLREQNSKTIRVGRDYCRTALGFSAFAPILDPNCSIPLLGQSFHRPFPDPIPERNPMIQNRLMR